MRRASRVTAAVLGLFAGGASIEHGVYEILQGNVRPEGLMISSMGPPCRPDMVWHRCEPPMITPMVTAAEPAGGGAGTYG